MNVEVKRKKKSLRVSRVSRCVIPKARRIDKD